MRGFAAPALAFVSMASDTGVDTTTTFPDDVLEQWGMDYRLCRGLWCECSFVCVKVTESHFNAVSN